MWTPSQFPLTVKLCMNLPEEVQLERLGYGRTRAVYSMPSATPYSKYGDCVLKLCVARQSHGKEAEWGRQCSLVAATVDPGPRSRKQRALLQRPEACGHGPRLAG